MKIKTRLGLFLALALSCGTLAGCAISGTPESGGEDPKPILQYEVKYTRSDEYTISGLNATRRYFADATVSFTVTVNNPEKELNSVIASAGSTSITVNEGTSGYSFKMPEHDVTLNVALKEIPKFEIVKEAGTEKKGLSAEYRLDYGGEPQAGFSLDGDETKVEINGTSVTFLTAGEVTLTAIYDGEAVATKEVVVEDSFHGESPLDPLSIKEALDLCSDLQKSDKDNKYPTLVPYYVKGIVTSVIENDPTYSNATVMLGDFEAYRCTIPAGFDRTKLIKGAEVVFHAKLLMFNSTPETHSDKNSPAEFVSVDISKPAFVEAESAVRSVQVGTEITVNAEIHPLGAEGTLTWKGIGDNITVTPSADGKSATIAGGTEAGAAEVEISAGSLKTTMKILVVEDEVHGETIDDPISSAKAVELATALESSTKDDKKPTEIVYFISDIVTDVVENDQQYSNATVWMGDFEVYRAGFADDVDRTKIIKGAEVIVKAKLLKFGTTCETHDGAQYLSAKTDKPTLVEIDSGEVRSVQLNHDLTLTAELHPVGVAGQLTWEAENENITATGNNKTVTIHGNVVGDSNLTVSFGSLTQTIKIKVVEGEVHGETADDPLTPEQAVDICKTLEASSKNDKKPTEVTYFVKGIVTEVIENDEKYKNATVMMGEFEAYRAGFAEEVDRTQIVVGAEVVVKAQLLKFGSTNPVYETHDGAMFLSVDVSKPYSIEAPGAKTIKVGTDAVVEATINPVGASGEIKWETSNKDIATVTPDEEDAKKATIHGAAIGEADVTISIGKLSKVIKVKVVAELEVAAKYSFVSAEDKTTALTDVAKIKGLFTPEDTEKDVIDSVASPQNVYQKVTGGKSETYFAAKDVLKLGKTGEAGKLTINFKADSGVKKVVLKGYSVTKTSVVKINEQSVSKAFSDNILNIDAFKKVLDENNNPTTDSSGHLVLDGFELEPGVIEFEFEEAQDSIAIEVSNTASSANFGVTFVAMELYK